MFKVIQAARPLLAAPWVVLLMGIVAMQAAGGALAKDMYPAATGPNVARALLLDATRADDRIVAVGERGIVLYSDDEGATWTQAAVPLDTTLTAVTFADARHGWATGHDAAILATTDGGESWVVQHWDPDLHIPLLDVSFQSATSGFAVGGRGNLFRTRDGGKTWANQVILTRDEFDSHLFGIGKAPSGSFFLAAERGVLYRSDDGGTNWIQLDSPYRGSFFGVTFAPNGRAIAFAMLGHVAISDDNGETWRMVPTGTDKSFMSATVTVAGNVVLAGLDGVIAISRDNGLSYEIQDQPSRRKFSRLLPAHDGSWLAFGEGGVKRLTLDVK